MSFTNFHCSFLILTNNIKLHIQSLTRLLKSYMEKVLVDITKAQKMNISHAQHITKMISRHTIIQYVLKILAFKNHNKSYKRYIITFMRKRFKSWACSKVMNDRSITPPSSLIFFSNYCFSIFDYWNPSLLIFFY